MNAERLLQLYDRVSDGPDAIPRLRRFILDLAVRGKLVEQDPNDEPAAELLRKIEDEKVRLVKAGEIRKPKDLPSVTEPPYQLPESWFWTRIRKVTSDRGQKIPTSRFTYIDVTSINKEVGVVSEPKVLEAAEAPSRARKIVAKGDVIYSCVRPYLLNVAVILDHLDPAPIASTAFAVLNGHGLVSPHYIWIVLRAPFMVELVEGNQRGQAYPAINDSDFAALPFPLPPLAEQHRIVAKVDELMALCDSLEAECEKRESTRDRLTTASLGRLTAADVDEKQFKAHADFAIKVLPELTTRSDQIKVLRQTILDLAVRGKLVEQDPNDEPAGEFLKKLTSDRAKAQKTIDLVTFIGASTLIPESWIWIPLGHLISKMDAGWSPQCESRSVENEKEWGVLKTTAVQALDFDARQNKRLPPKLRPRPEHEPSVGDILVTRAGPKNRVGVSCVVDIPCPRLMISDKLIRFRLLEGLSPYYVALALNAGYTFEKLEVAKSGMAVMQMNISQAKLSAVPIPLPPLAEQKRIVAKVDALLAQCGDLEQRLSSRRATTARLLEALLRRALEPLVSEAA